MKKGIFSTTMGFIVIFLLSATVIYSQIPIQQQKNATEIEVIKNMIFNVQIAREFADTALQKQY